MVVRSEADVWLVTRRANLEGDVRLFCFPYAGAGASIFSRWFPALPCNVDLVAIQLPGHETRIREAPLTDLATLLPLLGRAIQDHLDRPFAFLGHSMGALISFELARHLRREQGVLPMRLFLSGLKPVHILDSNPPLHQMAIPDFVETLQTRYGLPPDSLEHPELIELFMPVLRADFTICETYRYSSEIPLDCPITALGGSQDRHVDGQSLHLWQEHTTKPLKLRLLDGNHYFFDTLWPQVAQYVSEDITADLGSIR